jgi:hypothetical protein
MQSNYTQSGKMGSKIVYGALQTSASLGFIEQVRFELFEMYELKPSQA